MFYCFFNLYAKSDPKLGPRFRTESPQGPIQDATFVHTLLPFNQVRPSSARHHFVQLLSKTFSTLAPFEKVRPTSAPWPFLQFLRKHQRNKSKASTLQGMILEQSLFNVALFWFNVVRSWHPFGSMLVAFGIFADPFWFLFINMLPFGTRICKKHLQATAETLAEGTLPSNRPEAGTCRSHIDKERGVIVRVSNCPKTQAWFFIDFSSAWHRCC